MRDSLFFISAFVFGVIIGIKHFIPDILLNSDFTEILLYGLLLMVGISLGSDKNTYRLIMKLKVTHIFLPLVGIAGSLLVGYFLYLLYHDTMRLDDSLAISAGFGYYSLSSILITDRSGSEAGLIALIANISREILTLLFAPLMARYISKLAPIAAGGATSMDTTLPFVIKYSGKEYAVLSIFNGVVLSLLVPVIITLIYSF